MSLNAKAKENTNEDRPDPIDAGTHPVRLVRVLDMGVQKQREYKGEPKPPVQEIDLTYEFLDEFMLDADGEDILDKPRWNSECIPFHTLDKDKAKSTNRYLAFDPDCVNDGDWEELLGMPAMVTIIQKAGKGKFEGRVFDNINSAAPMSPKQQKKAAPLVNKATFFSMDAPDMDVYNSLPDWIKDKMKGALNYGGSALEKAIEGGGDEPEVPDDGDDDDEANW